MGINGYHSFENKQQPRLAGHNPVAKRKSELIMSTLEDGALIYGVGPIFTYQGLKASTERDVYKHF